MLSLFSRDFFKRFRMIQGRGAIFLLVMWMAMASTGLAQAPVPDAPTVDTYVND